MLEEISLHWLGHEPGNNQGIPGIHENLVGWKKELIPNYKIPTQHCISKNYRKYNFISNFHHTTKKSYQVVVAHPWNPKHKKKKQLKLPAMLSWTFQAFMYLQKFNGCIQQGINNVGRGTIHLSDRSAPERGGSVEKSKKFENSRVPWLFVWNLETSFFFYFRSQLNKC